MISELVLLIAGIASMKAAIQRGDLDEAARQGKLAGPAVVERALAAPDRATRLAGIVAASVVDDRAELLPALAQVAAGADRRTAIPAARTALDIARRMPRGWQADDDIADDDIATWRTSWSQLAMQGDRWIELRVLALDVAQALADPDQLGFDPAAFSDRDPAVRREAVYLVPLPAPAAAQAPLAQLANDPDPDVAKAAAEVLR